MAKGDNAHLADEGTAEDIFHGSGHILVVAYELQGQLGTAFAQLLSSLRHPAGCHIGLDLQRDMCCADESQVGVTNPCHAENKPSMWLACKQIATQ